MSNIIKKLEQKKLIYPPSWLSDNLCYITKMGSVAYAVSNDESDEDLYSFCLPPKDVVFPHLAGEIQGFGKVKKRFEQYQQHGIVDKDSGKTFDIVCYNIVKFFHLLMGNNPNILDSVYTHQTCVLHSTQIGNLVRDNRRLFLHKGCYHTLRGYAYSQYHKAATKNPIGKRKERVEKYGSDTKFLYHVVRLVLQCEQILVEQDLDLQRNKEMLKDIRRGNWSIEQIREFFEQKSKHLEDLYQSSKLPWGPNEEKIKELLLKCLESHYGTLDKCISVGYDVSGALTDIEAAAEKLRRLL